MTQLTAPIAAAAGVSRSARAAASSLNGFVTLRPANPSDRAAAHAAAKPSRGIASDTYDQGRPAAAKAALSISCVGFPSTISPRSAKVRRSVSCTGTA